MTRTGKLLGSVSIVLLSIPSVIVSQIHPPAPGVELPQAYYDRVRDDRNAFQFRHAWLEKTERIRQNRNRYIAERGFFNRDLITMDARRELAVAGTFRIPVMCGKYSNTLIEPWPVSTLPTRLFDGPFLPYTLNTFYAEISYGDLNVVGDVLGWTQLQNPDVYYEGGCQGTCAPAPVEEFIVECCEDNDPTIDFGIYDNDGPDGLPNSGDDDGFVDFAAFVHPEEGGECATTNIWSHRFSLTGQGAGPWESNDPAAGGGFIKVDDYVIQPAFNCTLSGGGIIDIGVFCHEFGHAFGLPDLYDTDNSSEGVGEWCLMGSGNYNNTNSPAHMCTWSKTELGWSNLVVVSSQKIPYAIQNVEFNRTAYRVDIPDERWRRSTACPIAGNYSMACGLTLLEGTARNWLHLDGYGNGWRERLSRTFSYNGANHPVTLEFDAKWDSEPDYDFTYLKIDVNGVETTIATFNGVSVVPTTNSYDLTPYLSGSGATQYEIIFEFTSDQLLSDAYGFPTVCAPFVVDEISLNGGGVTYATGFEVREDGWSPEMMPPPEYFLVENRQPIGSDIAVHGGGGLAIWHVESSVLRTGQDANTGGPTNSMPAGLVLEQADGLNEMGTVGNRGDGGDPYPGDTGNMLFDNATNPNSKGYNGTGNIAIVDLNGGNGDPIPVEMSGGYPLPTIASYTPDTATNDLSAVAIQIDGGVWVKGATVELVRPSSSISATVEWQGKDRLVATFNLYGVPGGFWDLVVTNPVNGTAVVEDGFYIDAVVAVNPNTPVASVLRQNYPNPFNPSTTISFDLREKVHATLAVYNLRGQLVRTLVDRTLDAATHAETWDGKDDRGQPVASGVYFARLRAGAFQDVRKMMLLK